MLLISENTTEFFGSTSLFADANDPNVVFGEHTNVEGDYTVGRNGSRDEVEAFVEARGLASGLSAHVRIARTVVVEGIVTGYVIGLFDDAATLTIERNKGVNEGFELKGAFFIAADRSADHGFSIPDSTLVEGVSDDAQAFAAANVHPNLIIEGMLLKQTLAESVGIYLEEEAFLECLYPED